MFPASPSEVLDRRRALGLLAGLGMAPWLGMGCGGGSGTSSDPRAAADRSVVVYTALDREFSAPVLEGYGRASGVRVLPKYDVESTKTVGLTQLIMAEAERPRCDLFWNNEILNTLRLKEKGLLQPFRPANADAYPEAFRAADHTWHGFAARARVLLVNTRAMSDTPKPAGLADLVDPRWAGRVALAKPLFGTTATHAACLFATWGSTRAREYFQALKANRVQIVSGNKQVAQAVSSGQAAIGLTDTDDAMIEVEAGAPVALIYPDREAEGIGTLFIPNTLAVIKGAPHADAAEALAGYLLSSAVETLLARGPSAQIPLNPAAAGESRVETPRSARAMAVDWRAATAAWDEAMEFLAAEFAG